MDPPRGGVHFPRNVQEFEDWFRTEVDAAAYLGAVRFRSGLACPRCAVVGLSPQGPRAWWCRSCRRRSTVTSQTVLANTNLDLRLWLRAAWQMTNTKTGVSSQSLERSLGISHSTAWHLLHKLRSVMVQTARSRLSGEVEIDETFVGGHEAGAGGRSKGNKQVVIVACESLSATKMGRVRAARIVDASSYSLAKFISENVEEGSALLTDGWPPYLNAVADLDARGLNYRHTAMSLNAAQESAHVHLPHVHRVAALLKRWLLGTHQGSVEAHHLDPYLDEFVFRFNRRSSRSRGLVFWRLVCDLVDPGVTATTRAAITARRAAVATSDTQIADAIEAWKTEHKRQVRAASRQRAKARRSAPQPDNEPF